MSALPYLPLFVADYESDTLHLDDAEHGRYVKLLMLMWKSPQCRIPNDDTWLARKMVRTPEAITTLIRPLIAEFCKVSGNWITQERLGHEWDRAKRRSKSQSEKAKSRWENEKDLSHSNTGGPPPGTTPIPTTTVTKEESKERKNGSLRSPSFVWPNNAWDKFWLVFPNKVGKQAAWTKFERLRKKGDIDFEFLMAALTRYVDKTDDRPWCNPTTWLNQGRWDDEPGDDQKGKAGVAAGAGALRDGMARAVARRSQG